LNSESNGIAVINASDEKQFSQEGMTCFFQPFKCRGNL